MTDSDFCCVSNLLHLPPHPYFVDLLSVCCWLYFVIVLGFGCGLFCSVIWPGIGF